MEYGRKTLHTLRRPEAGEKYWLERDVLPHSFMRKESGRCRGRPACILATAAALTAALCLLLAALHSFYGVLGWEMRCVGVRSLGAAGARSVSAATLDKVRADETRSYRNVYSDLILYTGLSEEDLLRRLRREEHFHFEAEYSWWAPASMSELAWYYRSSVSYLFANAIHEDVSQGLELAPEDGPVLDYSGGVGTTVVALAEEGIPAAYFGIGQQELEFARFRLMKRGLGDSVEFLYPYALDPSTGELRFDAVSSVPNRQFGVVIAMDVLEHIPDYHKTVRRLVEVLRPGGLFCENSPFGLEEDGSTSLSLHVLASMPMYEALGPDMELVGRMGEAWLNTGTGTRPKTVLPCNLWRKSVPQQ